jgi:enterochelin esterase-like enzyme
MELPLIVTLGGLLAGLALWNRYRHGRLLRTIEVVVLPDVVASRLGNVRDVTVFLPPRYRDGEEGYPVLYLNDGQEAAALRLHETLARLMAGRHIRPIITVAIPANDDRLDEYGTAIAPNAQGLGARAADYAHFLTEELIPLIEERFRVQPNAAITGVSLGGLSAFDIAWNHPGRFAAVGVMSGSFWWRAADDEERIDPGERIAHSMVRWTDEAPPLHFWFQTGTRDEVGDRDGNGVIDAIQDTLELIEELLDAGCPAEAIRYLQVEGGRHDYETWARVLPAFLTWAFTPGPARPTAQPSFASRQTR